MKNLIASIIVTIGLIINSYVAISIAVATYEASGGTSPANAILQSIWVIPSLWWMVWSINRFRKLHRQPPNG